MEQKYNLDCASWEITLKCNLKCFHCEYSAGDALSDELTTEEAINLVDDLAKIKCKRIIMMGGEVFLRKDWKKIAKHIRKYGIELAFISNGFISSKKLISDIKSVSPVFVGVSLDGGTAETHDKIRGVKGSFERALKFIDLCIESGIHIIVITSAHKLNIKELPILMDVLSNKKNLYWEIQITDVEGRFPKKYLLDFDEFYSLGKFITDAQKKHPLGKKFVNGSHDMGYNSSIFPDMTGFEKWQGCIAGLSLIAIESNGGIKGCSALTGKFVEDNIRNRSIIDIWKDPNSFSYNRNFKINDLKGFCRICKYGESCRGGCNETSFMYTGKVHCDPYCFHRLEMIKSK